MVKTVLEGKAKKVLIGDEYPTVLVGERINPTGKKEIAAALENEDFDFVCKEAEEQLSVGADVIDVNVGVAGLDEVRLLKKIVRLLGERIDSPFCLDSGNPRAIEAALSVCVGKPLLNSVTGSKESLEAVLPLARDYDASVIGLVVDEDGIPMTVAKRLEIAYKIAERAYSLGLSEENLIIDCLVQPIATDPNAVVFTLQTIKRVRRELSLNTTIGASNGSFGLPDRPLLNSTFLAMAISAGLNCAIADVERVRETVLAADLLVGKDVFARRFTENYRHRKEGRKRKKG
jgi:5-methyltetrahydrofolate--homocysteine methyltransferase